MQHFPQRLDHNFFLSNQLINDKANPFGTDGNHYNMSSFVCLGVLFARYQPALHMKQRDWFFPYHHHFLTINDVGLGQIQVENFIHAYQRESKCLVFQHHHQRRHNRQRQWYFNADVRADAEFRIDTHRTVQLGDFRFYNVHPHATARHIGNLFFGGKARCKNQVKTFGIGQTICGILIHQPFFNGFCA